MQVTPDNYMSFLERNYYILYYYKLYSSKGLIPSSGRKVHYLSKILRVLT